VTVDGVQDRLKEVGWVKARQRLQSLSWFMKCLKEPLARLANRQAQTRGAFFAVRWERPRAVAKHWGMRHLASLRGCPAG
jgi:hypothetical protein